MANCCENMDKKDLLTVGILDSLKHLTAQDRKIFVLRHYGSHSEGDISRLCKMPLNRVHESLQRSSSFLLRHLSALKKLIV